jgi:excisionase family DNA binding protein
MLTVRGYATAAGISERRVRKLISDGTIPATRFGNSWAIDEQAVTHARAISRPLSPRSAAMLQTALDTDSLSGLTGNDRARTAKLIRTLRGSAAPGETLRSWTKNYEPTGNKTGAALIRLAHNGNDRQISKLLSYPHRKFLNTSERLARVIRDERTISGLTIDALSSVAAVPRDDVLALEAGRWSDVKVGTARNVLRALDLVPSVLPARSGAAR